MKIKQTGLRINIQPLLWALQNNPQLWDHNTGRTADPESPHHDTHDIFCRYADIETWNKETGQHESVWYPPADLLPVKEICRDLMAAFGGTRLGAVLITKIPPGKSVKRHSDLDWHAKYYEKFAVSVAAHPKQEFCFDKESLVTQAGDVFWFDNNHDHWVTNESDEARITLIVCIRRT